MLSFAEPGSSPDWWKINITYLYCLFTCVNRFLITERLCVLSSVLEILTIFLLALFKFVRFKMNSKTAVLPGLSLKVVCTEV